jgi:hypothetical protein
MNPTEERRVDIGTNQLWRVRENTVGTMLYAARIGYDRARIRKTEEHLAKILEIVDTQINFALSKGWVVIPTKTATVRKISELARKAQTGYQKAKMFKEQRIYLHARTREIRRFCERVLQLELFA